MRSYREGLFFSLTIYPDELSFGRLSRARNIGQPAQFGKANKGSACEKCGRPYPLDDGDGGTRHLQLDGIKRRRHQVSCPDINQMPCAHITSIASPFNQDLSLACVESLHHDQRIIPTTTCPNRKKYDLATRQMLRKTISLFSLVAIGCGQQIGLTARRGNSLKTLAKLGKDDLSIAPPASSASANSWGQYRGSTTSARDLLELVPCKKAYPLTVR